jgi:membrane fusion protein, multidrug efflux system
MISKQKIGSLVRTSSKVAGGMISLAILALIIAWMSGMFRSKVVPDWTARDVDDRQDLAVEPVHEVIKPVIEEAVGTLRAASRTMVSSRLLATVAEIRVVAGQEIQRGDVMIVLDAAEYDRRIEQAQQLLAAAESTLEFAETDFERAKRLIPQNAISQAEFDAASNRLLVSQAEKIRAQQMVAEAEVMLSYRVITAPKAGRIVDRFAELGDLVQPGSPLISMYDAASLRLETPISEQLATTLRVGQTLTVYIDAVDREVSATVREIVPQADAASRSFLVKSAIDPSPDLYEGMFGRLRIDGGQRRHLCLNADALIRIGQLEYVDVKLPTGHVERRLVRTGSLGMPGRVEVLSGVQSGELVLIQTQSASIRSSDQGNS